MTAEVRYKMFGKLTVGECVELSMEIMNTLFDKGLAPREVAIFLRHLADEVDEMREDKDGI